MRRGFYIYILLKLLFKLSLQKHLWIFKSYIDLMINASFNVNDAMIKCSKNAVWNKNLQMSIQVIYV